MQNTTCRKREAILGLWNGILQQAYLPYFPALVLRDFKQSLAFKE